MIGRPKLTELGLISSPFALTKCEINGANRVAINSPVIRQPGAIAITSDKGTSG